MTALPAKHFAVGPYRAEGLCGPYGWWGVMNKNGFNVLTFADKPGAVVTDEEHAKQIADAWNKTTEFVYPQDTYVAPQHDQLTYAQMAKYIRSQRFVNGRWVSPIALLGGQKSKEAIDLYIEKKNT